MVIATEAWQRPRRWNDRSLTGRWVQLGPRRFWVTRCPEDVSICVPSYLTWFVPTKKTVSYHPVLFGSKCKDVFKYFLMFQHSFWPFQVRSQASWVGFGRSPMVKCKGVCFCWVLGMLSTSKHIDAGRLVYFRFVKRSNPQVGDIEMIWNDHVAPCGKTF